MSLEPSQILPAQEFKFIRTLAQLQILFVSEWLLFPLNLQSVERVQHFFGDDFFALFPEFVLVCGDLLLRVREYRLNCAVIANVGIWAEIFD